ncbi:sugar phosphate isomerase/epimerase [Methanolinea mesophila]|uniref:sugar phosphate isomerase/epimerase family protein n=1 Tax=Methanolinea mesophila TaxID=547055 RepID=UPI001AE5472C|nr:sugar phosphate isomerase/epimerase family protein [Methanolinea mesophila]MBP1929706.1 sugar phosphate isomerase/epimerase [Methanolinea mesophila]
MVQFAVSSMFFHEYQVEEIFDFVQEAGLDTMEFWMETPHFWLRDMPVPELSSCIRDHPVLSPVTLHAPILDLNPCSINPRVAAASVEYTLESIAIAERVGAPVLTIHPGRRTAKRNPSEADYARFEHYIDAVHRSSKGRTVKIAIENMENKVNSLLCTPAGVRELLDREPWLYFTLDISHAMGVSVEEVRRYIDLCHDRLVNVHAGRASAGVMHLPLDRKPEMEEILTYLAESGYRGHVTLELEDMNFVHDLCSEEKILILMEEVAFMRECFG